MMMLRSTMIGLAGLLMLGAGQVASAQGPTASVPPPHAPIAPGTVVPTAPEVTAPGAQTPPSASPPSTTTQPGEAAPETRTDAPTPTPGETLPATPAPALYAPVAPDAQNSAPAPGAPAPGAAGFDFGGEMMSPLPPPPAPVDPAKITRGPWRGRGWMGLRMSMTGPVGGEVGARPGVLSLGGGADVGWRINNVLGLGMGLSGQIHSRVRVREVGTLDTERFNNGMLYWDAAFLRVFMPLKRRVQPYIEVGGGLARLNHRAGDAAGTVVPVRSYGGQVRAAVGVEAWVSNTVTLGFSGTYRLNAFKELPGQGPGWTIGHAMQGVLELGLHW